MKCSRCGSEASTLIEASLLCEECHKPTETWTKRDEVALALFSSNGWISSMDWPDIAVASYDAADAFLAEKARRDK